ILLAAWMLFAGLWHPPAFFLEALALGVHQWDITVYQLTRQLFYFYILVIAFACTILLLKLSVILQVARIVLPLPTPGQCNPISTLNNRRPMFWLLHFFLACNIVFYIFLALYGAFRCSPISHAWNVAVADGKCADGQLVHIISAAIDTASDILIVILPQPIIWRLNIKTCKKLSLSAVFVTGILYVPSPSTRYRAACTCSAVRIYYATMLSLSPDKTYHIGIMGKWAEPELTFGFLAACMPVFPNFFRHLLGLPCIVNMTGRRKSSEEDDVGSSAAEQTQEVHREAHKKNADILVADVQCFEIVLHDPEANGEKGGGF
ncbi:hypothetical protein EJ04DRAFT_595374, partial [Polyplosphaeria fusca]